MNWGFVPRHHGEGASMATFVAEKIHSAVSLRAVYLSWFRQVKPD